MAKQTRRSGGVDFNANDIDVAGDVAGRDINIYQYYGAAGPTTRKAELPPRRPFYCRGEAFAQMLLSRM